MFSEAQVTYSWASERRERAQPVGGFEAAKSKTIARMRAFKRSCKVLIKLSTEKSISFTDMRAELGKVEAQYKKLNTERAEVESRYPSTGDKTLATKFAELVG